MRLFSWSWNLTVGSLITEGRQFYLIWGRLVAVRAWAELGRERPLPLAAFSCSLPPKTPSEGIVLEMIASQLFYRPSNFYVSNLHVVGEGTDNDMKTQCLPLKGCGLSPSPRMAEPGTPQPSAQPRPPDPIAVLTQGDVYDAQCDLLGCSGFIANHRKWQNTWGSCSFR